MRTKKCVCVCSAEVEVGGEKKEHTKNLGEEGWRAGERGRREEKEGREEVGGTRRRQNQTKQKYQSDGERKKKQTEQRTVTITNASSNNIMENTNSNNIMENSNSNNSDKELSKQRDNIQTKSISRHKNNTQQQ